MEDEAIVQGNDVFAKTDESFVIISKNILSNSVKKFLMMPLKIQILNFSNFYKILIKKLRKISDRKIT